MASSAALRTSQRAESDATVRFAPATIQGELRRLPDGHRPTADATRLEHRRGIGAQDRLHERLERDDRRLLAHSGQLADGLGRPGQDAGAPASPRRTAIAIRPSNP